MPSTNAPLREIRSDSIAWLSESKLKSSIYLRAVTRGTSKANEALANILKSELSHSAHYPAGRIDLSHAELVAQASDDYRRCILAKALAESYRKDTQKYRNEAARKQFFKRMATAAEATQLTESSDHLRALYGDMGETDETSELLKPELDRLMAQRIDLASEHAAKLNAARGELNAFLKELESLIGSNWSESDRYVRSLIVTSFFPPSVYENEKTWQWGSQWYPEQGVLNLNPPVLFFDTIRRGVIGREAAMLLSPRVLETLEDEPRMVCEQSEYLAYKLMQRKNDKELWAQARHGLRQKTRFQAHELIDFFHHHEMMVGETLYRELWSRLKELGETPLTVSDYFTIFNSLSSRPTNPEFNKSELRLLDALCKRPNISPGEAAHTLGLSIPTTMKSIKHLATKAGLLFTVVVDLSRIGLSEHLVLLDSGRRPEAFQILRRFPYCRQIFRTYGSYDMFAVIDVPEVHNDFVQRFLGRMKERGFLSNFKLMRLLKDYQAVNVSGYDVKAGRWMIHWDTWGVRLQDSLRKNEPASAIDSSMMKRYAVDKLDLNILFMNVVDCRAPYSSIGRNLGVSGAYVGQKVTRMINEGVFRYSVWPLKIGAEDWGLIVLSCSRSVSSQVARYLSELPAWRGGLVEGDLEGLVAMVWSPNGELRQLFKSIDDRVVRDGHAKVECLNSVGEWALARWLPVTKDDPWQLCTDDGQWLFDEDKYMSLVA